MATSEPYRASSSETQPSRKRRKPLPSRLGLATAWPPGRVVGAKLGVRHVRGFDGVVRGRKVEVRGAGDEDRPRPDRAERAFEIPAVAFVGADVAVLPGPQLGHQIVGVPVEVVALPVEHQLLPGLESELAMEPLAVERLRERPPRVDPRERPQTLLRGRRVVAARERARRP